MRKANTEKIRRTENGKHIKESNSNEGKYAQNEQWIERKVNT